MNYNIDLGQGKGKSWVKSSIKLNILILLDLILDRLIKLKKITNSSFPKN